MISINLLSSRRKEVLARQKAAQKFNLIAVVTAVVMLIGLSGIFLFNRIKVQQLTEKKTTLTNLKSEIKDHADLISDAASLSEKVDAIGEILTTRKIAEEKLDLFFNLQTSNLMQLRRIGLGGAANAYEFEFEAEVGNISEYLQVNDYLLSLVEQEEFQFILLNSLNRNESGNYTFNYLIRYNR